jgi:DNA processing protein
MDVDSVPRDRLIGWSLLPFLTPNRTRLLLEWLGESPVPSNSSAHFVTGLLGLEFGQAELVADPLHTPRQRACVAAERERVVTLIDDAYPLLLREIIDPPLALWCSGDRTLLAEPAIAVVGSRNASPYGLNAARRIAADLSAAGLTVVAGLARGIDAAAHQAALDAGGRTIAVLGTGIDLTYPRGNRLLFERIAREGLILSEFPPGTPPRAANFPIRNRVISGLTRGTVIVEATGRSGSLITARMAAEQGREVFSVPGSIFSAGSEGCHRLIQYGAKLVHEVDDVLDEFEDLRRARPTPAEEPELEGDLRQLYAALRCDEPLHLDVVAAALRRPVESLARPCLELEMRGLIRAFPGGRYLKVMPVAGRSPQ